MRIWKALLILPTLFIGLQGAGATNNIDLSTVPERASVQLTIYNSEDLTLVRERRIMSFKKGTNQLQFSWVDTLIDPTSVAIRFPRQAAAVSLVDTTFSHIRKAALVWNIESELNGEVETEISYFTSGLSWSADYTLISNQAEDSARLDGFIRVHNNSGEQYDNAQVRVVVGKINLVEKIAQLARVSINEVKKMEPGRRRNLRKDVAAKSLGLSRLMPAPAAVTEDSVVSAKQIIKEGLSEYFIYTVEGTESIPNGWSKRLRSFDAGKVPVKLQYRYRPREYGEQLVRMYLMKNDEKSGLGSTPLPNGKMSIFRTSSGGGLNYLASLPIKYVPVGDQLEVNLGNDPDVAFKLKVLAMHRDDIWLKLRRANAFKRVGDGATVLDNRARVIGWNENRVYARVIKNFSARPIEVHIRRSVGGDATLRSQLQPKRHDFNTFELTTTVATGATRELIYQVVTKQGRNSKQARLAFESATVTRPRF